MKPPGSQGRILVHDRNYLLEKIGFRSMIINSDVDKSLELFLAS